METEVLCNSAETEDGEILDDSEELYIPLERPHIPFATTVKPPPPSESDDDNPIKESSSDSDSSTTKSNSTKIRRKVLHARTKTPALKKKKYNIWCSDLQTELLTDYLVDCNVDQSNERVRDIESYNYKLGVSNNSNKMFKPSSVVESGSKKKFTGKRKHNGTYVEGKVKPEVLDDQSESKSPIANCRNILGLTTNEESWDDKIASDIANKLCEQKEHLILRAIQILGKETVISLFEETREIEASGGILVMNGTRRRTPGGVFFYLLKTSEEISRDKKDLIFLEDKKSAVKEKKRTAKEIKKIKAAKFKASLSKDDFPTLLSRTEVAIKEFKARKLAEESAEVKNPPPSPATDGKECSSDGEEQKERNDYVDVRKYSEERSPKYDNDLFGEVDDSMDVF